MGFRTYSQISQYSQEWVQTFNDTTSDIVYVDMNFDADGNILQLGQVRFGFSTTDNDALLLKYDSSGTLLWNVSYFDTVLIGNNPLSMCSDENSNIYVCGLSGGSGNAYSDGFLVKYNSAGQQQWVEKLDTNLRSVYFWNVKTDTSGNVYIAGQLLSGGSNSMALLIKYDTNGVKQWTRTFNAGTGDPTHFKKVKIGNDGNVYVQGIRQDPFSKTFVNKYSPTGNLIWHYVPPSTGNSFITDQDGFEFDNYGNLYFGVVENLNTSGSMYSIRLIKVDTSGNELFSILIKDSLISSYDIEVEISDQDTIELVVYHRDSLMNYSFYKYDLSGNFITENIFSMPIYNLSPIVSFKLDFMNNLVVLNSLCTPSCNNSTLMIFDANGIPIDSQTPDTLNFDSGKKMLIRNNVIYYTTEHYPGTNNYKDSRLYKYVYDTTSVSLQPMSEAIQLQIFPVPAVDNLVFLSDSQQEYFEIQIFDVAGKQMFHTLMRNVSQVQINTSFFAEGIYIVHVNMGLSSVKRKVVISK